MKKLQNLSAAVVSQHGASAMAVIILNISVTADDARNALKYLRHFQRLSRRLSVII